MQSEELINNVARRIYEDRHAGMNNIWNWDDNGLDDEHPGVRAQYEGYAKSAIAALSAAEPVGWQWRHPRATGGEWMNCPNGPRADKLSQAEYRPVYAAPPAPSVAVKALQMADETFRDLGWHDKYEATTAALASLSGQVQDVAGWQLVPIEPTDNMANSGKLAHQIAHGLGEDWSEQMKDVYRAMLAAAPAKQEG